MKLFKRLDNYLLHYYPTIWITRIHSFLPIGLALALLLFLLTVAVGWDPRQDMPDNVTPTVLMIIPVLIYLVYWFVFQSRYNVAKSGGKMPLHFEYFNFFSYLLVFFTAFLIISAIPLGNYQKIQNALNENEFATDVENLNLGNTLVNGGSEITFHPNGTVTFYRTTFAYDYYAYDYSYDYIYETEGSAAPITVTENEAEQLISAYIKSYNKYTRVPITASASELLNNRKYSLLDGFEGNDYSYNEDWDVQNKISALLMQRSQGWYGEYAEPWLWKISVGLMAFLALLVWIFKQMKLRQFVFGFIALCLTPLFAGIVGVILFEVIGISGGEEEETISLVALLFYLLFGILSVRAFLSDTLNNTGYVLTLYLQFFLPVLPVFLWLLLADDLYYNYYGESDRLLNFLYWCGWIIGLSSIAAFKPLYAKFRSLPARN